MDPALQAMLTEQITHQPYQGQDGYGTPVFGPAVTQPARVEYRLRRMVTQTGQERLSRAKVFLLPDVVQDLRDKLILRDGTAPALQDFYEVPDEYGVPHHQECLV